MIKILASKKRYYNKPALNFEYNGEDFQELCVSPSPYSSQNSGVCNYWKSKIRCFFIVNK